MTIKELEKRIKYFKKVSSNMTARGRVDLSCVCNEMVDALEARLLYKKHMEAYKRSCIVTDKIIDAVMRGDASG